MSTADRILFWPRLLLSALRAQAAYRGAFVLSIAAMVLNDGVWLVFWWLYFSRFPVVHGWRLTDIAALWAIGATAIGLTHGLLGNLPRLAQLIMQGELDVYLSLPKSALPHLLLSRVHVANLGDVVFGPMVFLLLLHPTPARTGLFLLAVLLSAAIFFAFTLIVHTTTFYLGRADLLAEQVSISMVTFSTYPSPIFQGALRVLLFTVLPAGFIDTMPISVLRAPDPRFIAATAGFAVLLNALALLFWHRGLRRYESGNLFQARL
ncbi:MAG: ABC-2 family transporter protein [Thermaerobacter sp.]|nr:ABC-2 family transporter protein [Thermaerobacter sp.]